ncbi:vegetative cell wall protein gp1-like [Miscanthus floridulus]|uniref:vegetative cell wall protein gp1-like n=1 Tax=Miscanthus floridulus TaxID=154761 RepID=UPI00345B0470
MASLPSADLALGKAFNLKADTGRPNPHSPLLTPHSSLALPPPPSRRRRPFLRRAREQPAGGPSSPARPASPAAAPLPPTRPRAAGRWPELPRPPRIPGCRAPSSDAPASSRPAARAPPPAPHPRLPRPELRPALPRDPFSSSPPWNFVVPFSIYCRRGSWRWKLPP